MKLIITRISRDIHRHQPLQITVTFFAQRGEKIMDFVFPVDRFEDANLLNEGDEVKFIDLNNPKLNSVPFINV